MSARFRPSFKHAPASSSTPWWKGTDVNKTGDKPAGNNKHDTEEFQEFDVAIYEGASVRDLKEYLRAGHVDYSSWNKETLVELQEQIDVGKCELGLDEEGYAFRLASISKVFVYDETNKWLLYNPVNSFEERDFVEATKTNNTAKCAPLQKAVREAHGMKSRAQQYHGIRDMTMMTDTRKRSQNVEIPSSFVFETTFSPFKETPRDAAARVLSWRLGLKGVTGRIFSTNVPMKPKEYNSTHFPGLRSEYHVHHVKLNPEFIIPLQKVLRVGAMSAVTLNEVTNTGINTHWYCWISVEDNAEDMVKTLSELYKFNPKAKSLLGDTDFSGGMAKAVGTFMKEEAESLDIWK